MGMERQSPKDKTPPAPFPEVRLIATNRLGERKQRRNQINCGFNADQGCRCWQDGWATIGREDMLGGNVTARLGLLGTT